MNKIFLLIALFFIASCSKYEQFDSLISHLGNDVYHADTLLLGAPDSISFQNATIKDNTLECRFWYNLVTVEKTGESYRLNNSILNGPDFQFEMLLIEDGFKLIEASNNHSVYIKN